MHDVKGYPDPVVRRGVARVGDIVIAIDGIRLEKVLGSGANGVVFAGEDKFLKRRVAVKVWPPRADRPRRNPTKQALAEARKLARLKSDTIVPIYRAGRLDNGFIYAVMEQVEGVPFTKGVAAELSDAPGFAMRMMFWSDVRRGLQEAERIGIYHGDLHGGNVLVRPFHATLIDFGTSALSGRNRSLRRHARMVNEFAQKLLPELCSYIPPLDIRELANPKYATWVVGQWVEAATALRRLDADLSGMSEEDISRQLIALANSYSTNLIDLHSPIAAWLTTKGVSRSLVDAYRVAAEAELAHRKATFNPDGLITRLP